MTDIYTESFKRRVVHETAKLPLHEVARKYHVSKMSIYAWQKIYAPQPQQKEKVPEKSDELVQLLIEEVAALQRRVAVLEQLLEKGLTLRFERKDET